MIHNSKYILKKELSSKANAHHDVTDFKFHGCWEIEKTEYLKNGTWLFYEIKKFIACDPNKTF